MTGQPCMSPPQKLAHPDKLEYDTYRQSIRINEQDVLMLQKRMKRFLIFPLIFFMFSQVAYGLSVWTLKTDTSQCSIQARKYSDTLYFQLVPLLDCLEIKSEEISKTPPILQIITDGIEILLNNNSKLYSINGQVQEAAEPFFYDRNAWWAPVPWIERFLMTDLKYHVYISEDTRRILVTRSEALLLSIHVIHQPYLTRIIFTPSRVLPFEIQRAEEGVTVWFPSKNVQLTDFPQGYSDQFIRRIERVRGVDATGIRLLFHKGKVRLRSYTLEAPYRFVVDFYEQEGMNVTPPQEPTPAGDLPLKQFDVVVIDPGHGGKETGTVGPSGVMEKDITLQVARKLRDLLISRLGIQVFLTRDRDISLTLEERTALANSYKADLFISIHANSTLRGRARGAETYYLSVDWLDEDLKAKLQEAEPNAFKNPSKASGDDVLNMILWDVAQTAYIEESSRIALLIQKTLNEELGISNRGVKQAPFRVLMGARMPAILIEIGFLNNAQEEKQLSNPLYQQKLALAITKSIEHYMLEVRARYRSGQPSALSH